MRACGMPLVCLLPASHPSTTASRASRSWYNAYVQLLLPSPQYSVHHRDNHFGGAIAEGHMFTLNGFVLLRVCRRSSSGPPFLFLPACLPPSRPLCLPCNRWQLRRPLPRPFHRWRKGDRDTHQRCAG